MQEAEETDIFRRENEMGHFEQNEQNEPN